LGGLAAPGGVAGGMGGTGNPIDVALMGIELLGRT
jgi:hypothetical protein